MFLTRSEYDRGITQYSPEGRLFQIGALWGLTAVANHAACLLI